MVYFFLGSAISTSRRNSDGGRLQQERSHEKEGDGRLVQPGFELQRGGRTGALDGHEGIPTGTDMPLAYTGAVIATTYVHRRCISCLSEVPPEQIKVISNKRYHSFTLMA